MRLENYQKDKNSMEVKPFFIQFLSSSKFDTGEDKTRKASKGWRVYRIKLPSIHSSSSSDFFNTFQFVVVKVNLQISSATSHLLWLASGGGAIYRAIHYSLRVRLSPSLLRNNQMASFIDIHVNETCFWKHFGALLEHLKHFWSMFLVQNGSKTFSKVTGS